MSPLRACQNNNSVAYAAGVRFIAINATALKIAVNGSILAKPAVLSAPVDQGACWRAHNSTPPGSRSAAVSVTATPRRTAVASWMRFSA